MHITPNYGQNCFFMVSYKNTRNGKTYTRKEVATMIKNISTFTSTILILALIAIMPPKPAQAGDEGLGLFVASVAAIGFLAIASSSKRTEKVVVPTPPPRDHHHGVRPRDGHHDGRDWNDLYNNWRRSGLPAPRRSDQGKDFYFLAQLRQAGVTCAQIGGYEDQITVIKQGRDKERRGCFEKLVSWR